MALALQAIAGSAAAATIYVDEEGPGSYTTIQAALNDAVDGDTIIVNPGTYPLDNIEVDKIVTIKGASGYPSIGGFTVLAKSNIQGLTITKGIDFDGFGMECTIQNNRFEDCGVSIGINRAYGGQTILNNLFSGSPMGVYMFDSWKNTIYSNTFENCEVGVYAIDGAGDHTISSNTFKNCDIGIDLMGDNAAIYNNYFSNDINLKLEYDGNAKLNTAQTAGTNIIGGPYIGGNFWGTPEGDGFSQTHLDQNGDGIAEEEYQINEQNIDHLPLVPPRTEPAPVLPVANFKANTTSGNAPLSVLFTDLSQDATSISWDVNNDGIEDSTEENFVHVYTIPGTYTINLKVSNQNGTASKTAVITVLEKEEEENENIIIPVADFRTNITSGSAPLSVLFTDLSQDATSISWDVNNDEIEDSSEENFVHVYTVPGTYTVNLTAINVNGTASKTAVITVLEKEEEENENIIIPVADFRTNITSGSAPLSVLFTDLSQDATSISWDVNNDGIEDSSEENFVYVYTVPGTYTVNLTAINVNGTASKQATITVREKEKEENDVLPVADFNTNVTSGSAPLSVLFTDISQDATSRSWDFNNDGISDSADKSLVYAFTAPGTYTVNLTAINMNGTASKHATITVSSVEEERQISSGGSSGGGGGGGGGSPEPAKNVKVKELAQVFVTNGKAVKFDFTKDATCVVYVSFDAKKNAGRTTTIVEELKSKSALVSELPEGEVYKSFNVWVGNSGFATSKNIENPVICFKVEKTWTQDNKVDKDSIILNRYSDKKWGQLPPSLSEEDEKYLYFTAEVPGFSSFAITGTSKGASEKVTENGTALETRSLQDEGNESIGLDTDAGQGENTKSSGIPPVYGIIGILCLGLICVIIYRQLPK